MQEKNRTSNLKLNGAVKQDQEKLSGKLVNQKTEPNKLHKVTHKEK